MPIVSPDAGSVTVTVPPTTYRNGPVKTCTARFFGEPARAAASEESAIAELHTHNTAANATSTTPADR